MVPALTKKKKTQRNQDNVLYIDVVKILNKHGVIRNKLYNINNVGVLICGKSYKFFNLCGYICELVT
jgi:hypothetical protein